MPDADIILEKDWTTIIRELRLGTSDGEPGSLMLYDAAGVHAIRLSSRPEIRLNGSGARTLIRENAVVTDVVNTGNVTASRDVTSREGLFGTLQVGGRDASEPDSNAGRAEVVDSQGETTVEIDGEAGSIRHAGDISKLSDARLKTRVDDLDDALETIQRLRGVSYRWDGDTDPTRRGGDREVGFLAQEVRDVLPQAVTVGSDGRLGTVDDAFTPYLVEAVKAQHARIEAQAETIDAQRERLAAHEERLSALETRLGALRPEDESAG